jgi:hypothetical protein
MDKEERKRKMAQAWCDFQERMMLSNSGCGPLAMAVVVVVVVLALCGCKSVEYVPVIEHHTDTLIQTKVQHDSIYINDSTVITEKGDTVKIEKWHTKYVEREVHDTTYVSKIDSIPTPYPVEVKVEKQLTWWQQTRLHLSNILLWLLAIVTVYYIIRWVLRHYV